MIPVIHALKLEDAHRLHCLEVKDENSHEGPACDAFFGRLHSALPPIIPGWEILIEFYMINYASFQTV